MKSEAKARKRKLIPDVQNAIIRGTEPHESIQTSTTKIKTRTKKEHNDSKSETPNADTIQTVEETNIEASPKKKKKKVKETSEKHEKMDQLKEDNTEDSFDMMEDDIDQPGNESMERDADEQISSKKGGHREIGGFTVIGSVKSARAERVSIH